MARVLEIEGETVDQALYLGLEQMQLSIDEVEMEVLDYGKKGFIGIGSKPARVKLTQREEAVIPEFITKKDSKNDRKNDRKKERREKPERKQEITQNTYFPEGTEFVENEVTEFLSGLMEKMGVEAAVKACQTDNGLKVNIEGKNMGVIIGRRGETLDAIQYLASLIYNKDKNEYHRVTVDTENYRKKREITLTNLAKKMAAQVERTGRKVSLEPMNPFERRIIHFALQPNSAVKTYSEGEEPNRHIVIEKV